MGWREESLHWLHRVEEAVKTVAEEFAAEYLEEVQDEDWNDADGNPYETRGADEIVRDTLRVQEFWIEARLTGLDPSALMPGIASSQVRPGSGRVDLREDWTDIALILRFLNGLDEMRQRVLAIPVIVLSGELPPEVRAHTVQASRCFALGLGEAASVLARSALEKALQDRLGRPGTLGELIAEARAEGLLIKSDYSAARKIQNIGNRAAHGDVLAPTEAELAVTEVRRLIGKLYPVLDSS